ncbi:hypothetical protein [Pontibacter sp. G13]|uniref:hypothetical protein n=1 Tax=Pontibacter sp. G13 TaxID=3074898 RepID=UPI002889FBF1|nr:hypothetical protein [Pontibacter sp. G13]WNJ19706.1 hypothetical protein RJD25_04420 [Pontibacter sp. G13]
MIIYGENNPGIGFVRSDNAICPNCDSEGTIRYEIIGKYFHIFWIPVVPSGKTGGAVCSQCDHVMHPDEMPKFIKAEFKEAKSSIPIPWWQFLGLGSLAILILIGQLNNRFEFSHAEEYLAHPKIDDVYTIRLAEQEYTSYRIDMIYADSVFMQPNDYSVEKEYEIQEIDIPQFYLDTLIGFQKSELDSLYQSGQITEINRP